MLNAGVIMEVHEATPWINSFVTVETVKDGKKKLRICLDLMPLSKAIMHEPYRRLPQAGKCQVHHSY